MLCCTASEFKSSGPIRERRNDRGSILNLYQRLLSKGRTGVTLQPPRDESGDSFQFCRRFFFNLEILMHYIFIAESNV